MKRNKKTVNVVWENEKLAFLGLYVISNHRTELSEEKYFKKRNSERNLGEHLLFLIFDKVERFYIGFQIINSIEDESDLDYYFQDENGKPLSIKLETEKQLNGVKKRTSGFIYSKALVFYWLEDSDAFQIRSDNHNRGIYGLFNVSTAIEYAFKYGKVKPSTDKVFAKRAIGKEKEVEINWFHLN